MKRLFSGKAASMSLVLALAGLGALFIASLMTAVEVFAPPQYSHSLATVSSVSAASWLVFDLESGEVLLSHEGKTVRPIASITKLLAAEAVYTSGELWATTTVTAGDVETEGRSGRLEPDEVYTLYELLFPLLLESSNDAAATLLRSNIALKARVAETDAPVTLVDASGLSARNQASAETLRTALQRIYLSQRQLIAITRLPYYLTDKNGWLNNSPFITMPGYIGGKHGYTDEAGQTAAVLFEESLAGGSERTLGYIVLGSRDLVLDIGLLRDAVQSQVRYR